VLIVRTTNLTITQGSQLFDKAQRRLQTTTYLPTWRGAIIDRKGRVIAEDIACYDIAIPWDVISGERFRESADDDAIDAIGREAWNAMSPDEKDDLVGELYLPDREKELDQFMHLVAGVADVDFAELERRLELIRSEVELTESVVWANQEKAYNRKYKDATFLEPFKQMKLKEHTEAHVVLPRVTDEQAMVFSLLSESLDSAIIVQHARRREYPYKNQTILIERSELPSPMRNYDALEIQLDRVAELIVGSVRGDTWEEDLKKRPFRKKDVIDLGGYRNGDEVGNRGLEFSLEDQLRGTRGRVLYHRNGEELERTHPVGGKDVHITLDIKLQARVKAILSQDLGLMQVQPWHVNEKLLPGTPLRGAVVVLDAETSEVISMVSTPAIGSDIDVEGERWVNRAAVGLYPPGSIIKPFVLVAAITDGELKHDELIECKGHYFPNVTNVARCWIYRKKSGFRTHGKLESVEAIARSCNIFFYELGTKLGFEVLVNWLQRFGMSKPLAAQLTRPEATGRQGHIWSDAEFELMKESKAIKFETVSISIGQGGLTWSPLHAAAAYATLARNGLWRSPTLVQGNRQNIYDLELNQEGVELALDGLRDSVTKNYGTGSTLKIGSKREPTFNVDGVKIWGKTGTAQAPGYIADNISDPIEGLTHAWFVVMASSLEKTRPSVVVVVLVEHGGYGGLVAGPIANQVLHALLKEGYFK